MCIQEKALCVYTAAIKDTCLIDYGYYKLEYNKFGAKNVMNQFDLGACSLTQHLTQHNLGA